MFVENNLDKIREDLQAVEHTEELLRRRYERQTMIDAEESYDLSCNVVSIISITGFGRTSLQSETKRRGKI